VAIELSINYDIIRKAVNYGHLLSRMQARITLQGDANEALPTPNAGGVAW